MASLCNDDREVVVLRCDSASKGKWTEHVQEKLDDKTLKVQMIYFSGSNFFRMKWKQLKAAKVNTSSYNQNTDTSTVVCRIVRRLLILVHKWP